MANYANLKSDIAGVIRTNNNEEITGDILQEQLLGMVDSLGAGYQYKGVATPTTAPGTPDENVFYIASTAGTYPNFGGAVVADGEVAILKYNGTWTKEVTGAATAAQVTQLGQDVESLSQTTEELAGNFGENEVVSNNILAPSLIIDRTTKYIRRTNGTTIQSSGGFGYTDFIPLDSRGLFCNVTLPKSGSYAGAKLYYDDSKSFLGYESGRAATLTNYPTAMYVRFNLGDPAIFAPGGQYEGQDYAVYIGTEEKEYDEYREARELKDGIITTNKIATGAVTTNKIAENSIETPKIKDSNVTKAKVDFLTKILHESTNLLNPDECAYGLIRYSDGAFRTSEGYTDTYATGFIPIDSTGIISNAGKSYGTTAGWAVYNSAKEYIRGDRYSSSLWEYQTGDAFIRMTINNVGLGESLYIVRGNELPAYSPYFDPYYTYELADDIIIPAPENIPSYEPALSLAGKVGTQGEGDSLANGSIILDDYPQYIKRCFNLSASGKITSFEQIDLGVGQNTGNGTFLRVDATNIYFCRDNSGSPHAVVTQAHGLTISQFIDVSVLMDDGEMIARIATYGGTFTHTFNRQVDMEIYGKPFVSANENTALTGFSFRAAGVRFRLPVWIIGDSYCSWYSQRWPKQLSVTFGVSDFLLDGLAGGSSGGMFGELQKLLKYGTPKFLIWCLGMNDTYNAWLGIFNSLKALCEDKGITLILQTIPWPVNNTSGAEQKALINTEIKASGLRYFDGYAAVSSDDNGTWYEGYCADDVHPTVDGAKAMAARFLVDFPEMLQ